MSAILYRLDEKGKPNLFEEASPAAPFPFPRIERSVIDNHENYGTFTREKI